ncbi:hypothetical protein LAD12857_34260 [Lacrimispora amygdalina]|uniref:AraC-type arabinose-binding/dimerisation domain-containing protein n=1 Tax=Lacrimispora amygdalina TaxID=253257 RepID=A0ABQ5M979_9FIRM
MQFINPTFNNNSAYGCDFTKDLLNIRLHWHEQLQFYYFVKGEALLECGHNHFEVSSGSIVVINSNELHYLESLSDDLEFYAIRIEPTFLFSNQVDLLQTKYLAPLTSNSVIVLLLRGSVCKK